ncbi:hypothetical protein DL770_006108 [Monosporascus sp. CRB-9-2]|nr:hypothetical protein DL770_006108 [Monosporascus sp. CRB-9-2]
MEDVIGGMLYVGEERIFLDPVAWAITIVVLGINILVALVLYPQTSSLLLPRQPGSIGSIFAYIANSRLPLGGESNELIMAPKTYSYGSFEDRDGQMQVGIEQDIYDKPALPQFESSGNRPSLVQRLGWGKYRTHERLDD